MFGGRHWVLDPENSADGQRLVPTVNIHKPLPRQGNARYPSNQIVDTDAT
jgi:hypothetical protein